MPSNADTWGGDTDWRLVRRAAGSVDSLDRDRAWARLLERYREPVRRSVETALREIGTGEEAVDDFFAHLFQRRALPRAHPRHGRFRAFVQDALRAYVEEVRRDRLGLEPLDELGSEIPPDPRLEAEEEAAWADAVLGHALDRLRRDTRRDADVLVRAYGLHGHPTEPATHIAASLDLTENALHVALHRARGRLREAIVAELAAITVQGRSACQEYDALVGRLLAAHPGLVSAADETRVRP